MDFINIVPRIALGVIGSGANIAAVILAGSHHRLARAGQRLVRRARRCYRRRGDPGGPVVGFSIGAVALKVGGGTPSGDRLCRRLGAVYVSADDLLGSPVHAGPVRVVSRGGIAAVSVPGRGDRDGDREAVRGRREDIENEGFFFW